jgi:hypothetical protein
LREEAIPVIPQIGYFLKTSGSLGDAAKNEIGFRENQDGN